MSHHTQYLAEVMAYSVFRPLPSVPSQVGDRMCPVAWYGVKKSSFQKGRTALITGAGPVRHPQCLRQGLVLITVFFLDRIVSPQSFTVFPSLSC